MALLGTKTVVAVFESVPAAEAAKGALLREGVPEARIALSASLTEDAIGAEAPGQSFENQPGQRADRESARYGEAVRSGGCVLSVFARSDEEGHFLERLLQRRQAYRTGIRP